MAISVPALVANAVFRLNDPRHAGQPERTVTVSPPIAAVLNVPAGGLQDTLVVSTEYAHRGNVVALQVQSPTAAGSTCGRSG